MSKINRLMRITKNKEMILLTRVTLEPFLENGIIGTSIVHLRGFNEDESQIINYVFKMTELKRLSEIYQIGIFKPNTPIAIETDGIMKFITPDDFFDWLNLFKNQIHTIIKAKQKKLN